MKKALIKDSIKEIKNTYKRFISILLMAFLGVGFFAGIKATSPDMVDTINDYYNKQNVYDIEILSTLGLTQQDVEKLENIEEIEEIVATYETDAKLEIGNTELITKIMCLEELNKPVLINGTLPQNENECVVEESFLKNNNKNIGDIVELKIENITNDQGEEIEYLKQNNIKIVGTIESPLYISRERGTSKLGSGKIDYLIYIDKQNIKANESYTQIYIKLKDSNSYKTSRKEYENYINNVKHSIEDIKQEREQVRYNNLIKIATNKYNEAEKEFNKEKEIAQEKIKQAQDKIITGKKQIEEGRKILNSNKIKADIEFEKARKQIQDAKNQIENNEKLFKNQKQEIQINITQANIQKEVLNTQVKNLYSTLLILQKQYTQITEKLNNMQLTEIEKNKLLREKEEIQTNINNVNNNIKQVENNITKIEKESQHAKKELEQANTQINNAKTELSKREKELEQTMNTTYNKINERLTQIKISQQQIEKAEMEIEDSKKQLESKTKEAEAKLIDAKDKISQIEHPKWYILDRYANSGYNSFIQDTKSIENIGKVFPIVFFVVATLISLTSMTRMVEEQRTQIGTLKALGYNTIQILNKYIIYASLACMLGGILGMSIGFIIIPKIIWMMYQMMYQIPIFSISFNLYYGGVGLLLISTCILGATIYSTVKELTHTPADLMRPKAPKMGKRVLLERIPIIWKHLSFTKKVTVRNIFRYKKRFLMTIIGICGCTSLILAGFGLKDSIKKIMPNQFEKVFNYDIQISLKKGLTQNQIQDFINKLEQKDAISKIIQVYMSSTKITNTNGEKEENIQIIVPNNENNLKGIININDIETQEKTNLEYMEIVITDKVAQLLGVKRNDSIVIKDKNDNSINVKISSIAENYISHYIYMSKQTYEKLYNEKYDTNILLVQNIKLSENQEEILAKEIMQKNEVANINRISLSINSMNDTMESLNYVVIVLIISAGLLAFVVLYNLSNVNISERIRELATIKVLGFYDREVYSYITRETVILTIIGIILGLIGGYFLNYFIIGTCEINALRFSKIINPISYVYSILITVAFTIIVNIATFFALKNIDMIESLKSVE